ncbi:putative gustatory receptor 28b [Toxorhynchites rutilus septentrionalis]|uniref:putative gustatory receptor 28b n=1 Tax=Toxorhynchites rutilus septentrionalis TaxID=329112 RepID=UPI002478C77E|nr:putative gustatory receptor 28b [Toxorhynchites rutilus septentrionalis]
MALERLRKLWNPKNFYAAQRPILRTTFLMGMTPFTVICRPSGSVLECTLFGYINSSINAVIFCSCYVIALYKWESVNGHMFSTEISTLGDVLQMLIGLSALVMTFIYSIVQRNKLIHAFHSVAKTDEHFREIGVETDYKSTLKFNYLIIGVQICVHLTYCVVSVLILSSSGVYPCITAWVSYFYPFLMMSMVTVLFICLVNQVKHRFYLLNKILQTLREISTEKQVATNNGKRKDEEVKQFRKPLRISSTFWNNNRHMPEVINQVAIIQGELCDACNGVEDYFSVQMLAIVTISFVISVFDSYYILETIIADSFTHWPFSKAQFVAFFLYQAVVYVVGVIKIVYWSNSAVKENEKIAVNVHKLINANNYDEELTRQLSHLSLQLTHRKVTFTAYGFFNLDFTLLFTLIGAATTYLVILVQFSLNQNAPCGQPLINTTQASLLLRNGSMF